MNPWKITGDQATHRKYTWLTVHRDQFEGHFCVAVPESVQAQLDNLLATGKIDDKDYGKLISTVHSAFQES